MSQPPKQLLGIESIADGTLPGSNSPRPSGVEPIVIFADPSANCRSRFFKGTKVVQPETFFFDCPDHPSGLGIALRIVVGTENLMDARLACVLHEGDRSRLRGVIRNKAQ
jgi:hypothetical protein